MRYSQRNGSADTAFASHNAGRVTFANGGMRRARQIGIWGRPEALKRLKAHNPEVHRTEKVSGTTKRSYGPG